MKTKKKEAKLIKTKENKSKFHSKFRNLNP